MIYDKLRKLPKVIQMEIYETGDLYLLTDDDNTPLEVLVETWDFLESEYNRKYNKQGSDKVFDLSKEIEYQSGRHAIITLCCEQLLFDKNEEVIGILKSEGYQFDENNYKAAIEKIHRESKGILIKINQLKNKLPKPVEGQTFENDIIKVMASYSTVLGISFDFNAISVEAFHSYEAQVKAKIQNIEKQIAQQKSNSRKK